ncbi:filamentation protein [Aspergillus coremiiformis]|uniref:Filamentation protein n=1 Tax=Aspergillus coremiiformis TaxID=138285 RepID=A0A5N6Z9H8_9EURO|nr:filamentation protein [Aspergillus coremiiformis]
MAARDSEKARRYIAALDNARCQNKWDEVPELIRKVTKHAPQRTCLLQVASIEYQIVLYSSQRPSSARPGSASSSSALPEFIPPLLSTVEHANDPPQDIFQAQVCLGWIHWTLNDPGSAAARLPNDLDETLNKLTITGEELSPWTKVCVAKACYLKGAAQHTVSGSTDALDTLHSLTLWLSNHNELSSDSPQFLHWSEQLASESALVAGTEALRGVPLVDETIMKTALRLLRVWSAHPRVTQGASPQTHGFKECTPKYLTWKSYYDLLSAILQHHLTYIPPASGPELQQLATELRHVESAYESSLLRETKFPTADTENTQMEDWVEQVITNWEILCGPQWADEDLEEGGQTAVGRNVLDILYRAATKTYHSHLVLRRLFHVHSALADFDLALKALDSYVEIVVSAKERAEKSAQYGELENDGTLLRTLAEGVTILCCFGSAKEAEKARELTTLMKKFINKHVQEVEGDDEEQVKLVISPDTSSTHSQVVSPSDIAAAYRGVGIGLAAWASWTPVNEERDDIRAEAIDNLEKSTAPELEDETNYSSLYTLALLLAEDRDLDGAIDCVKTALTAKTHPGSVKGYFTRERDLVPLWHLLALLLSAKHDFDIAERSCEAAFEQFPAAVTSLAHHERRPQKQQQATQDQVNSAGLQRTLIKELRGREKERIIETRMTQLAFVELLEGPEAAVNHSEQLLGLFAALFGNLSLEADDKKSAQTDSLRPPSSSGQTVKSLRGSIFGRHKGPRAPDRRVQSGPDLKTDGYGHSVVPNESDQAPVIQVTDEDKHTGHENPQTVTRSDSRTLRQRSSTLKKGDNVPDSNHGQLNGNGPVAHSAGSAEQQNGDSSPFPDMVGAAESPENKEQIEKQPLRPVAHNMSYTQPPEQDVRLPTSYGFDSPTRAVTKFPLAQAQKHALCILVKIWLLIAGLYRRAALFDDAIEACDEAAKHVTRVEALCAAQESSARSFRERGWGAPKSVDELWADLLTEQALLFSAQSRPHTAMEHFEKALMRDTDHPKATIGLANLLLDIWDQKMPLEPPEPEIEIDMSMLTLLSPEKRRSTAKRDDEKHTNGQPVAGEPDCGYNEVPHAIQEEEPILLNRISARDRAYGLLSALTKRGSSWDNSEAWYTLSRAYEAEGNIEKLKEVLWWCIELEDRRPIRHWSNVGSGVYVL